MYLCIRENTAGCYNLKLNLRVWITIKTMDNDDCTLDQRSVNSASCRIEGHIVGQGQFGSASTRILDIEVGQVGSWNRRN